jgi:hypothetical protein
MSEPGPEGLPIRPISRTSPIRSISLHIERLVIDGSLLPAGGERELRHALVEALEQMLPGAITSAIPGAGRLADAAPTPGAPVTAGRPAALAAGVAGQVVEHARSAVGSALSPRWP